MRVARTNGGVRQSVRLEIRAPRSRLTPINQIRSWLAARSLQGLRNDKGETLREQQAQNPTVHLPQTILPPPGTAQLALAGDLVLRLVV